MLIPEPIDDAASGIVQERLTKLAQVVVSVGTTVEGLDVLRVEGESRCGIFDNLLPITLRIVACSPVGVVNRVRLTDDGLRIELNCLGKVSVAICFVARLLELGCILLPLSL